MLIIFSQVVMRDVLIRLYCLQSDANITLINANY